MADAELPLTPRAKRTLAEAQRVALGFGHGYVGTEHLMLALLADPNGIVGGTVHRLGVAQAVRDEIVRIMRSEGYPGGH